MSQNFGINSNMDGKIIQKNKLNIANNMFTTQTIYSSNTNAYCKRFDNFKSFNLTKVILSE